MRRRRVEQAIGETICHDMTSIQDGIKSVAFKRGHVIVESDIPILKRMGKSHIYVWDPNPDEIHEDEAGLAGAKALTGPGLVYDGPREGRYTITAAHDGLFTVNRAALRAFNAVPDYTAATRPNHSPVKEGEVVAGIRIVPLVTARENVERVEAMTQILTLRPFAPLRTGIIITGNEVYDGLIQDCFEPVLRDKLAPYGAEILSVTKCPDDQGAIV
ncbi:MAG: hypothetical protein FWC72_00925, partial [Oscillospiraceae bacterium]|nr:hypothetical protein [Oscillospiraceae bacterium]